MDVDKVSPKFKPSTAWAFKGGFWAYVMSNKIFCNHSACALLKNCVSEDFPPRNENFEYIYPLNCVTPFSHDLDGLICNYIVLLMHIHLFFT